MFQHTTTCSNNKMCKHILGWSFFQAGTIVEDMLETLEADGWTIPNAGAILHQTIAGVASTNTRTSTRYCHVNWHKTLRQRDTVRYINAILSCVVSWIDTKSIINDVACCLVNWHKTLRQRDTVRFINAILSFVLSRELTQKSSSTASRVVLWTDIKRYISAR